MEHHQEDVGDERKTMKTMGKWWGTMGKW